MIHHAFRMHTLENTYEDTSNLLKMTLDKQSLKPRQNSVFGVFFISLSKALKEAVRSTKQTDSKSQRKINQHIPFKINNILMVAPTALS